MEVDDMSDPLDRKYRNDQDLERLANPIAQPIKSHMHGVDVTVNKKCSCGILYHSWPLSKCSITEDGTWFTCPVCHSTMVKLKESK